MKKVIKKVFYPHKKYNPRPIFWHPLSVSVLALAVLFISGFITIQKNEITGSSLLGDIRTGVLITFTNKERTKAQLPELSENELLTKAAQLKVNDMAKNGYFAHYSPTGISPWYWFTEAGYVYQRAGENLAVNFDDSEDVVQAWMNSPTHKENIIKEGYTEIGIATAEGYYKGKKAVFIAQLFGSPRTVSSTGLALLIEKKASINENEQTSVRGAQISAFSISNIFQIFTIQTYVMIMALTLLSLIILGAILVVFKKGKSHTKKFYISILIPFIVLIISIYTQITFFKDISITVLN